MLYIVGDIHGEVSKLLQLIKNILHNDKKPSFVFIGDYLDKGENPKATLEYLVTLSKTYNCKFLIGNHEYVWMELNGYDLDAEDYLQKYGGLQTIKSFKSKGFLDTREKMMSIFKESFFEKLIPYFQYKNFLVTHSGIPTNLFNINPVDIPLKKFLFNRYDFIENRRLFQERYKVIFGHTGFYTPFYDGYKIGIDTAACFLENQPLTAFNADEEYFINSDNQLMYLSSFELNMCPNIIRKLPWRTMND